MTLNCFSSESKYCSMNIRVSNFCRLQRLRREAYKSVRIHYLCIASSVKYNKKWVIHQDGCCATALHRSCKLSTDTRYNRYIAFQQWAEYGFLGWNANELSKFRLQVNQVVHLKENHIAHNLSLPAVCMICSYQSHLYYMYLNPSCWIPKLCRGVLFLSDKVSLFLNSL